MVLFASCAIYLSGNAGLYSYIKSGRSYTNEELDEIQKLLGDKHAYHLPIEPVNNMGINRAPKNLVCSLLMPELLLISAYIFLVWEMLNA